MLKKAIALAVVAVFLAACTVPPLSTIVYHYYSNWWPPAKPMKIMHYLNGVQHSYLLSTALDIGVFETLRNGPKDEVQIATEIKASVKGTYALLNSLVVMDLLEVSNNKYDLTGASRSHLLKGSDFDLGGFARLMQGQADLMPGIKSAVVNGGSVMDSHAEVYDHKFWHLFAENTGMFMKDAAVGLAKLVDDSWLNSRGSVAVMDSACGSGVYGFTFAQQHSQVKDLTVTFFDYPGVLKVTKENQKDLSAGSGAAAFEYKPGDLFADDVGGPYDVITASHIYHHFNITRSKQLTAIYANALKPGGKILVNDFIKPDGKPSLFEDAMPRMFDAMMLAWTRSGQAYSFKEFEEVVASVPSLRLDKFHGNWPFPWTYVTLTKL